jgi:hypothetical protein
LRRYGGDRYRHWEDQTKLESACWRQAEPFDGDIRWRDALGDGLGRTSTRQLRIRRDDLLKIFPELTVSAPQVTARRMRKVQRVERWLTKNRRWIRCHELKEWLEHPMHRDSKRPAKDPVRGFIVREFQIGSDSRLRLLTQFSSVVRFSDGPPVRPAKSTDVRKLDPYDDPVYDPSRNYFSDLWATNEACRELVKEMWLPFPAHWHTVPVAQPPEGVELGTISVDRDKAASKTAAGSPCPGKRRGPKPVECTRVMGEMQADIASGKVTYDELKDMNQEALAETYGTKRATAQKALKRISNPQE